MSVKMINKAKERLDADGNLYYVTEGDTTNDPELSDKGRRKEWRKVYPKGGR
jgi:16S rRNA G1207 methylase RsmC